MSVPSQVIRILIVDDHATVRQGLVLLLGSQPDFTVVGAAEDGAEAVRMAMEHIPDVVLMDYSMPGMNGAQATKILSEVLSDVRVVFLTSFSEPADMMTAFASGAVHYVLKDSPPETLIQGIRIAAANIGQVDK